MKALLLFPPAADPAHPPLGIASLAGFLRAHDEEVALIDFNIRAYNALLTADFLTTCNERLEKRLRQLERRRRLPAGDRKEYAIIAEALLSGPWLAERIDDARRRLHDPATYANRASYGEFAAIVRRSMQLISAAHHPAQWTPGGFSMSHPATRSAEVLRAIEDRRENLFLPIFEAALPEIVAQAPDIVGISINYHVQMIPAMTLAAVIRRALPDVRIVAGGGLVCFYEAMWERLAPFRAIVDAWIPFEGEKPLLELMRSGGDAAGIDGVLRFDGETPLYHPPGPPPAPAELPPPLFDGLPLHDYLAPEPILPLLTSRGCYWGRCAFCSHAHLYRGRYRARTAEVVIETFDHLSRMYGVNCFYLVDEAIPPRTAIHVAEIIASSRRPTRWFGEARFERFFSADRLRTLAAGGCRMLIFGLESAVPRVLDLMEKGITPELAGEILASCHNAGIRTFIMFFSGFPTETREEAERTVAWIDEHRHNINHVATGQFVLEPQAPVYKQCARYGIADVFPFRDEDLKFWSQYRVERGMTTTEAGEFARDFERRPDDYLISRSHLVFFPVHEQPVAEEIPADADLSRAASLVPRRHGDLVPRTLKFNLDQVRQSSAEPVTASPTSYVFSADREALIEVGDDGIALLRASNGDYTLEDIIEAAGLESRDTTLQFFRDLARRRFIDWEVRA